MTKKLISAAWMGVAVLAMGITMPQCPGQQAMQQQIDDLRTKEADLNKKLAALETAVRPAVTDVAAMKQGITPMVQQVQAMAPRLDTLEAGMKDIQAKMAAAAAAPAKSAAKKRR